jgi:SAM-dependent methyltransferase
MPRNDSLRLLPITAETASYWNFWIARVVSLIAYAFLFIAPMASWNVSVIAGEAVRVIAVFSACTIGIVISLQNKAEFRALLLRRANNGQTDALARFHQALARFWHVIAVVYFVAFFLVWVAQPRSALTFMIGATVETVVAIAVGLAIVTFISRLVSGGMRLSPDVRQRLPLLESRLNAFVPKVLAVVRFLILVAVVAAVADAWDFFDVIAWVYLHLPPADRHAAAQGCLRALKPGGLLILECFSPAQEGRRSGGPKLPELLWSRAIAEHEFAALEVMEVTEGAVRLDEGLRHQGLAEVVRGVWRRPL